MNLSVTIVCLCYNHEKFVEQALESVVNQWHTNWELIVVDDGSSDGSVKKIENFFILFFRAVAETIYRESVDKSPL